MMRTCRTSRWSARITWEARPDHHMPPCGSGPDNLFHGHAIDLAGKKGFHRSIGWVSWIEILQTGEDLRDDPAARLVMRLGLLQTGAKLACHTLDSGVVDHLPAQASGDASRNLAAPLPYSREIVTARIRLMVSIASLFMIGSSSRGTLLLSGVTAHS